MSRVKKKLKDKRKPTKERPSSRAKPKPKEKPKEKKPPRNKRINDISTDVGIELAYEGIRGGPSKFNWDFCDQLIEHMKTGHSFETFSVKCDVGSKTLHEWVNKYDDFANAKKVGEKHRQYLLESIGLSLAVKGKGSAGAWIFQMKNICGWQDKVEAETPNQTINITYRTANEGDRTDDE